MEVLGCMTIGYLLGSLSPAALLSKIKNVNLREKGTKNLGASNAMIVLGKVYGLIVMVLDIAKAYIAAKIAKLLFPRYILAAMIAALGAVLGHIFPFYMHFRGGKGLAAFGGMVMAYEPWLFAFLLSFGLVLMYIFNCSVVMPMFAAFVFPLYVWFTSGSLSMTAVAVIASVIIVIKHWSNIALVRSGKEINIRRTIGGVFKSNK